MSKKTLVIGASTDPTRYAFLAANRLLHHGHEIELIGKDQGKIGSKEIQTSKPDIESIDTVTMYISPKRQPEYYDYIVGLKPKRVIFNPGTENPEFEKLLAQNKIEPLEACTLVMLSTGQY
ncbi:CoA-binding protein [Emticicia sp. BO119]|uniref:CoA-binding protein n=1 Tax=Emticicia sp. BO119 TaxID=2757768 RepID=UPI0015F007EA|nr:CoA-binding protein [Emticicia sp. BO119]MBA4850213.1 CoA-binding protein [Emticicia sp. BO119]